MNAFQLSFLRALFAKAEAAKMDLREYAWTVSTSAVLLVDIYRAMVNTEHCQDILTEHLARKGVCYARFSCVL